MKNLVLICVSIFGLLASEVRGCSQGNLPSINWVNCRSAGFFGGLCDHCMSVNFRDGGSLDYICLNAATDNPSWCIYSGYEQGKFAREGFCRLNNFNPFSKYLHRTLLNDINTPVALSGPSGCENNRNAKLEVRNISILIIKLISNSCNYLLADHANFAMQERREHFLCPERSDADYPGPVQQRQQGHRPTGARGPKPETRGRRKQQRRQLRLLQRQHGHRRAYPDSEPEPQAVETETLHEAFHPTGKTEAAE